MTLFDPEAGIRRAEVTARDAREAAAALHGALAGDGVAVVALFVPPDLDRAALQSELDARFAGVPVVGCTTAGAIGPGGVGEEGIVGFSLAAPHFRIATERVTGLADFVHADGIAIAGRLERTLVAQGAAPSPSNTFAMLLVDGLSGREEKMAAALDDGLGGIPLFGGSAGDGLRFGRTAVLADGRFDSDCAVVVLVHTDLPFRVFKNQHLVGTGRKLVVTAADRGTRTVTSLDGEPAAVAYSRAIGVPVEALKPQIFATNPVVVRVGDSSYVRSIRRRNDDDSLTFYCTIEPGMVLRLAEGRGLVNTLADKLDELRGELGPLRLVIGCDCILRRLEASRLELNDQLSELFVQHRVIGFGTYGEQYRGVHVNQTFTGVAIGAPPPARP